MIKIILFEHRYKGDQMDGLIKKLDLIICTEDPRELTTEVYVPIYLTKILTCFKSQWPID